MKGLRSALKGRKERQQVGTLGADWIDILSLGHGLTFI